MNEGEADRDESERDRGGVRPDVGPDEARAALDVPWREAVAAHLPPGATIGWISVDPVDRDEVTTREPIAFVTPPVTAPDPFSGVRRGGGYAGDRGREMQIAPWDPGEVARAICPPTLDEQNAAKRMRIAGAAAPSVTWGGILHGLGAIEPEPWIGNDPGKSSPTAGAVRGEEDDPPDHGTGAGCSHR